MKTDENLSTGIIRRIVFIALVLIILLGIGVFAGNQSVNSVTIKFSDGTELNVITSHSNVNDILKNKILVINRNGIDTQKYINGRDNFIVVNGLKEMKISSTEIREFISNKNYDKLNMYLDKDVIAYIMEHDLYGGNNGKLND